MILIEILGKGGWLLIPIGVCLVLSLAITIERFVNLRLSLFISEDSFSSIRKALARNDYDAALQLCRVENKLFNRLAETLVFYRETDSSQLRQLIMDQSRQESVALERFLPVMRTIATVAPLLGLLGTVTGMIKVFQTLSLVGVSQAQGLSGGISEALLTTAAGLSVAIPTLILVHYFEGKAERIMLRVEKALIELNLMLRGKHALSEET
ncbi:MAG: biopolymer transporter [Acidobacteria bacterium]|nr:MAG: biopolymer transporter [Acidobacteriota bacterium]